MILDLNKINYCPFYCEENIWYLSQHPAFADHDRTVVFISNLKRQCLFLNQKAGGNGPVIWDYHVILMVDNQVWDLDTLLPQPYPLPDYLKKTFPPTRGDHLAPLFKWIDATIFIKELASDRSHMLDKNNRFIHPPPPWPCIQGERKANLFQFIDMKDEVLGTVVTLAGLR